MGKAGFQEMSVIMRTDVDQYQRDGFVLKEGLFSPDEVRKMIHAVEYGDEAKTAYGTSDKSGRAARLAIWFELKPNIWGAASTCPRIVNAVRVLLGEDAAFFHGKVMMKEAKTGGAWEWHQDYGYWYDQGFIYSNMISAFVALDEATIENGCLQVLRGSHRLERLNHGQVGTQVGVDTVRLEPVLKLCEKVHVTMKPGSVLFFHSNLLHSSSPNMSERHRRSFIMCYTATGNPQVVDNGELRYWKSCPVGAEDGILQFPG